MKKNFLYLMLTVLLGACSLMSKEAEAPAENLLVIDTSPEAQARFKTEWLNNMGSKVFSGDFSLASVSKSITYVTIDTEGNLFNSFGDLNMDTFEQGPPQSGKSYWPMYRILKFKSGTEALVTYFQAAVAPVPLYKQVYALVISNDKLYRTEIVDPSLGLAGALVGFTSLDTWDGKSYSGENLANFADKIDSPYYKPTKPAPAV